MVVKFDIDASQSVVLANKLEKLNRSAFPVSVRGTLNSAAFDVKQKTMLQTSKDAFENRDANFFKATSRVEMAKGFDPSSMASRVGFVEKGLRSGNNQAVQDLEQQEKGGTISGRSFVAMDPARTGNSNSKKIRPNQRLSSIKNIVDSKKITARNSRQAFVKAVNIAGVGGHVLAEWKGREILWRVNSLNRNKKGGFKLTPLYSFERGRSVHVDATHFMKKAADMTEKKIPGFFEEQAKKQFEKALGR